MAKKIASLYAEIGADTTKLKAGLDETKGQLTQAKAKMDNFKASALPAIGIVAGFGAALKGAYDTAKEGAALDFSAGKFDRLAESIGTTSEALLGDLKKATRGTVSDMTLMGSAGDFMALGLAKSREEVVRLTRVAGALGMDMNQLVLTLTNQTTMRFDALGVSVDGFDEKVEALKKTGMSANDAFNEAFLRQAEEQITKVGDKADTAAGQVAAMEASFANLGDTIKVQLAGPLGNVALALNGLMTNEQKIVGVVMEHETAVRANSKSYAEYRTEMDRVMRVTKLNAQVVLGHAGSLEEVRGALGILNEETYNAILMNGDYIDTAERMRSTTDGVTASTDILNQTYVAATGSTLILSDALRNASDSAGVFKEKIIRLDDIDPQFGSKITSALDDLKFQLAGGLPLQQLTDDIIAAFNAGKLTPEQAQGLLGEAFVAEQALQVDMDKITADVAAQNVAETLGISLADAKKLVLDTKLELATFPKELYVKLIFDTQGAPIPGIGNAYNPEHEAAGGQVYGGNPYWVGERGPEPFVPSTDGRILSREDAMEALSNGNGGATINVTQIINTPLDYVEAAAEIEEIVRRNR